MCAEFDCDLITSRMPISAKLPVLNLLTGQKSVFFSAPHGRLVAPIQVKLAVPTGTWVRLAVQSFASIAEGGGKAAPKISKNFASQVIRSYC